jgi:hypothetical protein
MARRADPERIYQARRAAVFSALTGSKAIDPLEAEHRIAAWERDAERQGLDRVTAAFWEAGDRWLTAQGWAVPCSDVGRGGRI